MSRSAMDHLVVAPSLRSRSEGVLRSSAFYLCRLFLVVYLFSSAFVLESTVAWPGQGVIAIYYQTNWSYPITIHYLGNSLAYQSKHLDQWWGPEQKFESPEFKYVEIAGNVITSVYFTNESGAVDDNEGVYYRFDECGVFALYSDHTNSTVQYFWPGCPGVPPTNALVLCSAHGVCNQETFECSCDSGWSCPACECSDACDVSHDASVAVGEVSQSLEGVYSVKECCTKCIQAGSLECVAATFHNLNFTCQLFSRVENVTYFNGSVPLSLIHFVNATPSPNPRVSLSRTLDDDA